MAKKTKDFSQQVGGVLGSALAPEPEPDVLVTDAPAPTRRFGSSSVKALSILSTEEADRLATLEATIDRGMTTFLEVGRALIEIQDNKLYRATHLTIEQYMLERFSLNRNRGYQLIEAAKVVNQIAEEIKPASAQTADTTEDPSTEGYQAVPTGKIRRSKSSTPTDKQPVDVDYTEEPRQEEALNDSSTGEHTSEQTPKPSFVWSAPEEEETDENQEQADNNASSIPLPATESHAAALAQVPEDQRTNVWKKTVAESQQDGKPITASRIKKTAEKVGVPLNKKAPKDRKGSKNAFGKNADPDDEFSDSALEHTRQAMNNPAWLSEKSNTLTDSDLSKGKSVDLSDKGAEQTAMDVAPVGSRQALSEALGEKIFQAQPGEIMIILRGTFLIREGLSENWQMLRGDDRTIDEQYTDTMTIQEFWDLIGAKR